MFYTSTAEWSKFIFYVVLALLVAMGLWKKMHIKIRIGLNGFTLRYSFILLLVLFIQVFAC